MKVKHLFLQRKSCLVLLLLLGLACESFALRVQEIVERNYIVSVCVYRVLAKPFFKLDKFNIIR